jgi:two-component system, sensor histidine kinase
MEILSSEVIRAVLESAPDAMLIVDSSGTIRFANQHVAGLFGYPRERVVGLPVEALIPARYRTAHEADRGRFMKGRGWRAMGSGLDLVALRADGTEFPVEISLAHVVCEPESFVVAAIRDITSHLQAERALREAREQAERANLAKSRFLAAASHDLRQPLQSLSLLAGTLRRLSSSADVQEAVGSIESAIDTMSRLLNALLDVSKLESGTIKPDIRDFPVAVLFRQLRTEFAAAAHNKGLELVIDPTREDAHSDPLLLGQILRNLIANAIRYTKKGTVTLSCRRDGDALRIEVHDTGIGMARDQLQYIYDEFYQIGHDAGAVREGYGLGLAIVQRLVRLLQLRIEVTSEVGVGTSFALTLPRGAAEVGAAAGAHASRPGPRPGLQRHLLLIEDDPAVLSATRMLLGAEGYRVTATSSAQEAVRRAGELRDIDVIVADFHLGNRENGADAITSIRAILGQPTKAVLVTGDIAAELDVKGLDGSLRVVHKPVAAEELLATLRELLGG